MSPSLSRDGLGSYGRVVASTFLLRLGPVSLIRLDVPQNWEKLRESYEAVLLVYQQRSKNNHRSDAVCVRPHLCELSGYGNHIVLLGVFKHWFNRIVIHLHAEEYTMIVSRSPRRLNLGGLLTL